MKSTTLVQLAGAGWVLSTEGPLTPTKYGLGNTPITAAAALGRAELARSQAAMLLDGAARLERLALAALNAAADDEDPMRCAGCGCLSGDGPTEGCHDRDGCGWTPHNPNPTPNTEES